MADAPRQRVIPKVALPKVSAQSPVSKRNENSAPSHEPRGASGTQLGKIQASNLGAHIGSRVRVTNTLSQVFVGEVYLFDVQLVLSTGPYDYHIIPAAKIVSAEVISLDSTLATKKANGVAPAAEKEVQAKLKEQRQVKPPGVSNTGQKMFLMLDKTWHEKSIIVLDNVLIEPPYNVETCKAPAKHAKQLERVKELVKNELEKLTKDRDSRKGG